MCCYSILKLSRQMAARRQIRCIRLCKQPRPALPCRVGIQFKMETKITEREVGVLPNNADFVLHAPRAPPKYQSSASESDPENLFPQRDNHDASTSTKRILHEMSFLRLRKAQNVFF